MISYPLMIYKNPLKLIEFQNLNKMSLLLLIILIVNVSCINKQKSTDPQTEQQREMDVQSIIPGAEMMDKYVTLLRKKKIACVVNHSSLVKQQHLVDTLLSYNIKVMKVFAPEHGFRGDVSDGEWIADAYDTKTGLPIISLYGTIKKPTKEHLDGIDIVVFDIQDVGSRFYTYLTTLHLVMEACAENGIPIIVLDRPNPHIDYMDGPVLDLAFRSFIGMHPVPVVCGMTIGEYALMINGEGWMNNAIKADLTVIPVGNYNRNSDYTIPIAPSPNLPNQRSVLLYPSLCFFEGTYISVGRGTDKQFQVLGNPHLGPMDFQFTPVPNRGSSHPPHKEMLCYGEDLSIITLEEIREKKKVDLSYLLKYYKLMSLINKPFFIENNHFTRLAGTDKLRKQIEDGWSEEAIRESWKDGLQQFSLIREKYLIYE